MTSESPSRGGGGVAPARGRTGQVGAAGSAPQESVEAAERVIFSVRPSFVFVGVKYAIAAILWLIGTALVAVVTGYFGVARGAGAIVVALTGVALFAGPAFAHLRRQRIRYTLTNYKLEIQTGLFATTTRNIRLSKIQDVTVTWSIVKRMLGIGDLAIDTAAEAGRLYLTNIPKPKYYADILLRELQRWN